MKSKVWMRQAARFVTVLFLLTAASYPARAQDGPTIVKDSIQFTADTDSQYRNNNDIWSWVPHLAFRVNGPIESGDQLYVEVTLPGRGLWVKFDCETRERPKGDWMDTECGGGYGIPKDKNVTYVGPVSFAIRLRNPLSEGGPTTLFTGKTKVVKARSNQHGPKAVNQFVYYVDHDWNLPIGYVYLTGELGDWNLPMFAAAFWIRGDLAGRMGGPRPAFSTIEPHLVYQGKEVGLVFEGDTLVGKPGCEAKPTLSTTQSVEESVPQGAAWTRVICIFPNVRGWDKTGEKRAPRHGWTGEIHVLSENPGDYELKILATGRLARSLKFAVAEDGTIVDNGIATANKLGSDKVIVPVKFTGAPDGVWNKLAWKTDAFYGNPLTGFTWVP